MKKIYLSIFALLLSIGAMAQAIRGDADICLSTTTTLSCVYTGGTWSSSDPSIASINATTGVVRGVAVGWATISYVNSSYTALAPTRVIAALAPITGGNICSGRGNSHRSSFMSGTWSSSAPSIASIARIDTNVGSQIYGVAPGTATITFSTPTCGMVTKSVTVLRGAVVTGNGAYCIGQIDTLQADVTGGRWVIHNDDTVYATVDSISGIFRADSNGYPTVAYYLINGCSTFYTPIITEAIPPNVGPSTVCIGSAAVLVNGSGSSPVWTSSNPAIATVAYNGIGGSVTGISAGTATITYFAAPQCFETSTITVVPATCSGMPLAGTAMAGISGICSGAIDTLRLTGTYSECGTIMQWEHSADGSSWADLPGATATPARCHPLTPTYYRCKVTCLASGMSAYSTAVFIPVRNTIAAHSIMDDHTINCNETRFSLQACGLSASLNAITYYGDGLSDTSSLHIGRVQFEHSYSLPGTYSVKHVFINGGIREDSVMYPYVFRECNNLKIRFFNDNNRNGVFDGSDPASLTPVLTEIDSNGVPLDTVSVISGWHYKAYGPPGTIYTFRTISTGGITMSYPASGIISDTITSATLYPDSYFGIYCGSSSPFDFYVHSAMECGRRHATGIVYVRNIYCNPVLSDAVFSFSPKYRFDSATPAPASVIGNTITWHLDSATAWLYRHVSLKAHLTITDTTTLLPIGDTVHFEAHVIPAISGNTDTTNNHHSGIGVVSAGYDPNDIAVSPKGLILPCTKLTYTVRFENTGNGPATNVHVQDTLPDDVDLRSLEMVMASHPMNLYTTTETGQNIVKFDFPNIMLADSSHPEANKGTFVFTVKTKSGLADGVVIPNRLGIYFDINEVVMTNTVENTIGMAPITGPDSVCRGGTIGLACATEGGVWASSNAAVTVTNGLVAGNTLGTSTISYTVSNECTTRTKTKVVTIEPSFAPTISVAKSPDTDTLCVGTSVTFTATGSYTGTTPRYTWQVNGTNTHTGSSYNYVPKNAEAVTATLTSNGHCAVPAQVAATTTLRVQDTPALAVSISAVPSLSIWKGQGVTFTATASTDAATYQWLVNGSAIAGATSATYTTTTLAQGDQVSCEVTAGGICGDIATTGMATVSVTKPNDVPVLSPNPTNGTFAIAGWLGHYTDEAVPVDVTDAVGRVYYRDQLAASYGVLNATITLPRSMARGVYFFNIRSKTGIRVLRFVVL